MTHLSKKVSKRIAYLLIALVMLLSPIFAGCFGIETNTGSTGNTSGTTGSLPGGTSGGIIGGNTGGNDNNNTTNNEEEPEGIEISADDYADYFKNYRITFKPGETERQKFNEEIIEQNNNITSSILHELYEEYGDEGTALFSADALNPNSINIDDKYLVYESENSIAGYVEDYDTYFSHAEGIRNSLNNKEESVKWRFARKQDNGRELEEGDDIEEYFESDWCKNRMAIAEIMILSGEEVVNLETEEPYAEFETTYNSYINRYLNADGSINDEEEFNALANSITHLGYTEQEVEQLKFFVLYYVIGIELVDADNTRFKNCYYDGNSVVIDNTYNRFLTDETYATGSVDGSNLEFTFDEVAIDNDKRMEGLLYYAGEYLKAASLYNNFVNVRLISPSYLGNYNLWGNLESTEVLPENSQPVAEAIYKSLIATEYRHTLTVDEKTGQLVNKYNFNGNVWGYGDYDDRVVIKVHEGDEEVERTLFSVRLPYFKNYYNTVHLIVSKLLSKEATEETKQAWIDSHDGEEYPYKEEYPSVPFTYFADYDNGDMLYDGSSATKMFSGYQSYQSMVLMPQQLVKLSKAAIFVIRERVEDEALYPDGTTDHSGDFDLTVYVRYYDARTQTFAKWIVNGEESEFYVVETKTIDYEYSGTEVISNNGDETEDQYITDPDEVDVDESEHTLIPNLKPTTFEISVKDIMKSAIIDGVEVGDYTLEPFDDDTKLSLHNVELVTKENFGNYFKYVDTPDGNQVVCFDGKNEYVLSQSYFEIVFSASQNTPFQFCFYPTVAIQP